MMSQQTLYKECPLCGQAPVVLQGSEYRCQVCGLTLKDRSLLGLFRKGQLGVSSLGQKSYPLAEKGLKDVALPPDPLKVAIGNVYTQEQLEQIAAGNIGVIRPVKTILAQIILEQLNEECFINVNNLRRGHGQPLAEESWYEPAAKIDPKNLDWQDEGNLFCTTHRIVLPSNKFTFIRLDRKVVAVQAYLNGFALQRKGEEYATYFVGCLPHESALVAAYIMAKVPRLRPVEPVGSNQI